jgi:hypothetical protein
LSEGLSPTLILDEAESLGNSNHDTAYSKRQILNSGFRKGGMVRRTSGKDYQTISEYKYIFTESVWKH